MLLANLLRPDWMTVNCSEKIIGDILCFIPFTQNLVDEELQLSKSIICSSSAILHKSKCYSIFWGNNITDVKLRTSCKELNLYAATTSDSKLFKILIDATDGLISPVFYLKHSNFSKLQQLTFESSYLKYKHEEISSSLDLNGYHLCIVKASEILEESNLFACEGKVYISQLHICDGIYDCPGNDDSDEVFCFCRVNNATSEKIGLCAVIDISKEKHTCSPLYYKNSKGECSKFKKQNLRNHSIDRINMMFNCTKDLVIDSNLQNDLINDCGPNAQDEPKLKSLLKFQNVSLCGDKYKIPCLLGHSKCYHISDICIYQLNELSHLAACRNGKHLQNCKDFECNMMFKCPSYYCISWLYVCDGKWDCPDGTDESAQCINSKRCATMYKCQGTSQLRCIPLGRVCDDIEDCLDGDDELLCELKGIRCPNQCECLALAIFCTDVRDPFKKLMYPYLSVSIYFSKRFSLNEVVYFQSAMYLRLINVSFTKICNTLFSEILVDLNAQFNPVETLVKNCFSGIPSLISLQLQNNRIKTIETESFNDLFQLRLLNLSNNILLVFPNSIFSSKQHLDMLSLLWNPLKVIDLNVFESIKVDVIETTIYQLCCIAPAEAKCTAQIPWFISCSNLLPSNSIRFVYGAISILIMVLATCSVVFMLYSRQSNMAYSIIAFAININDSLFGVYLMITFAANEVFYGNFLVKEVIWRSSSTCFFSFGLVLLHSINSPFLLFFLSLSRLHIVLRPYDTPFKRPRLVSKCVIMIFIFVLAVTVSLSLLMKQAETEIPTSLCLPFVDPNNSALLIKVITLTTSSLQILMSIIILFTHFVLVKNLQDSEVVIRSSATNKSSNVSMIAQLIMITGSNIICWFPTNTIYLVSMYLPRYPSNMVIWTAVAVAPINSIINPAVFLFTSVRKIKEI